jgi:2-(3-amino-3-carboxypropyl)histidine synthase
MLHIRHQAVEGARRAIPSKEIPYTPAKDNTPIWGVILGTLGRQGSFKQLQVSVTKS